MTIKRLRYTIFWVLLFFSGTILLQGQVRDFQSWWEVELNKKISDRWALEGEVEQRFKNNSLQYSRTLFTLGASFDLMDFLTLGGGVRNIFVMDREQNLHARYRSHLDLTANHDLSGFSFSLRTRLQYGFGDFSALREFSLNTLVNRNRLKATYHVFGTKFDFFASVESWHDTNTVYGWITYTIRYTAGTRFSPNFRSRFSLRYFLEDEFNLPDPRQFHVLVLGYNYRF